MTETAAEQTETFAPPEQFAANANVKADEYERAEADYLSFWAEQSRELVDWHEDFGEVLDWTNPPFAKWFVGGKLNVAYNCLDRHVLAGNGDRVAINFEGEPGDSRIFTYAELLAEVSKAANTLTDLGVKSGDRVAIYLPMIPEAVISMLACARLGAAHSVVFGGFSADALHSRIIDAEARVVITADGSYRRAKPTSLKPAVDEAISQGDTPVEHVLVVKRTGQDVDWVEGRDQWWEDSVGQASDEHECEFFDSEHPLFILYTSGTTGKPKGILHTTGGYLTQVLYSMKAVFDIKPETDVFWCTADVGWVTGHSYVTYGPLAAGTTQIIYEGTPDTPHQGRWWEIIEKYKATILYAAPTAIRTCMKWGEEIPAKYDLSSLRLLGSVGEPINPEAWMWYREHIGGNRCPVVDTWWQTENGSILISPLPGVTETKPGSAMRPLPGIVADVFDDEGNSVEPGNGGYLVVKEPWPSMLRTLWGDEERFKKTYWSQYPEVYFAGDGAKIDRDGDFWVLGRVDDVLNVSGHRMSTAEIESALVAHPKVAEAAVVGAKDEMTGQAIEAFVILRESADDGGDDVVNDLRSHVRSSIGPIATPRSIMIVPDLPKTRSGKIMRRLLKDVAENREVGDVTTLADSSVMDLIQKGMKES